MHVILHGENGDSGKRVLLKSTAGKSLLFQEGTVSQNSERQNSVCFFSRRTIYCFSFCLLDLAWLMQFLDTRTQDTLPRKISICRPYLRLQVRTQTYMWIIVAGHVRGGSSRAGKATKTDDWARREGQGDRLEGREGRRRGDDGGSRTAQILRVPVQQVSYRRGVRF